MGAPPHDIADLRARLAGQDGPALWRSFEAVADTPGFPPPPSSPTARTGGSSCG